MNLIELSDNIYINPSCVSNIEFEEDTDVVWGRVPVTKSIFGIRYESTKIQIREKTTISVIVNGDVIFQADKDDEEEMEILKHIKEKIKLNIRKDKNR